MRDNASLPQAEARQTGNRQPQLRLDFISKRRAVFGSRQLDRFQTCNRLPQQLKAGERRQVQERGIERGSPDAREGTEAERLDRDSRASPVPNCGAGAPRTIHHGGSFRLVSDTKPTTPMGFSGPFWA